MIGEIDSTQAATRVLDAQFATFDTASDPGVPGDGLVTVADLQAVVADDARYTPEQQQAAAFLLSSTAARSFLDVADGIGAVDGAISQGDVDQAQVIIAGGGLEAGLLDTAAGAGTQDGYVGSGDLSAVASDPGIPDSLKSALQNLPPGLPLQTQLDAVVALRQLHGDPTAVSQLQALLGSTAFKGLDEAQQHQALLLLGTDSATSASIRTRLAVYDLVNPDAGGVLENPAALRDFMRVDAQPVTEWLLALPPGGVPDARRQPVAVPEPGRSSTDFIFGVQGSTAYFTDVYNVDIDGHQIAIHVPIREEMPDGVPDGLEGQRFRPPSVEAVIRALAAQPPGTLEGVDRITLEPFPRLELDENGSIVVSDTGASFEGETNTIRIHPTGSDDPPLTQGALDFLVTHEVGHSVEQPATGLFGLATEWNLAVYRDRLFATSYAAENYPTPGAEIVGDATEDFADAYAIYQLVKGTPDEVQMRALMPARFDLLDRMYG